MIKKNILIISFSNIKSDPRVQRQINVLLKDYQLTVLGFGDFKRENLEFISIQPPQKRKNKYLDAFALLTRMFETYYYKLTYVEETAQALKGRSFDIVIANDIEALPIAIKANPTAKIWYDAHEYSPRENEESLQWRLFFQSFKYYLCRKYMPKAHAVTTVCDGIAEEYSNLLNIKVGVIKNSSEYHNLEPSNSSENSIKLIHHGAAIRGRKLESMIQLMDFLDQRFHLNFMLVPTDPSYLSELKLMAEQNCRVTFLSPVEMKNIPDFVNKFDLGIYFLEPTNFNQKYALPNKIFEFIQGRLGIVIGPSLEMAKFVKKYNLGLVTDSFDLIEISKKMNLLTRNDVMNFKEASHLHAKELSFEGEINEIHRIISTLSTERTLNEK